MIAERDFLQQWSIGGTQPLMIIAGPCVIESADLTFQVCDSLLRSCEKANVPFVFKSSFDKANRSSLDSKRGVGLDRGLKILQQVKEKFSVPIITDVHERSQISSVATVADILQIPAFLCRQTDLLQACASTGRWVNVKKGQFLSPLDCEKIKEKTKYKSMNRCIITERGTTFGYHDLLVDARSVPIIHGFSLPYVIDATHSLQMPATGKESGGQRRYAEVIARSSVVQGIEGLFFEAHPDPDHAWSDSKTQLPLAIVGDFIERMARLDQFVKNDYL